RGKFLCNVGSGNVGFGIEVDGRIDRHVERVRQIVRQCPDLDHVESVVERPTKLLDRFGLAVEHDRDLDVDVLGHRDLEQIDVERPTSYRVDLHAVDERREAALAIDLDLDEGGRLDA